MLETYCEMQGWEVVAVYQDDDLDGESAGIANQRAMLETYCEKQGWGNGYDERI